MCNVEKTGGFEVEGFYSYTCHKCCNVAATVALRVH